MNDDPLVLYIIFPEHISRRLTPGQIAAQAAHAATEHSFHIDEYTYDEYLEWKEDTNHHFGLTLVGVTDILFHPWLKYVTDPYVHFLTGTEYNVVTCGWIFCRKSYLPEELNFRLLKDEYLECVNM
jgi:hypothetical protein